MRILTDPDYKTVCYYRLYSRWFKGNKLHRLLGRLLFVHTIRISSCHISPLAHIGPDFRLMHGTGIVIGTGVKIGSGVKIYQNVTLGDKNGYPVIGDNVTIYPGACILGPVRIGNNAIIGANAVVMIDVLDNAKAAGIPARILINH